MVVVLIVLIVGGIVLWCSSRSVPLARLDGAVYICPRREELWTGMTAIVRTRHQGDDQKRGTAVSLHARAMHMPCISCTARKSTWHSWAYSTAYSTTYSAIALHSTCTRKPADAVPCTSCLALSRTNG